MESVNDTIYNYYKIKNEYEETIRKEKRSILKNNKLESSDEKRKEYNKYKPKCYACKQSGGTIFATKLNKEAVRIASAVCGHVQDPCGLHIEINLGNYDLLKNVIDTDQKNYTILKNMVIANKNQMLFGYKTAENVLENYEEIKEKISDYSYLLEQNIQDYFNIMDSSEKKDNFKQLTKKSYAHIQKIKECIHEFDTTNNKQFVQDAVGIYVNELTPVLKELMQTKYSNSTVLYDDDTNTYNLVQQMYTIEDVETVPFASQQPKVIKYNLAPKKKKIDLRKKENTDEDEYDDDRRDVF
jgi:hypothetical protein